MTEEFEEEHEAQPLVEHLIELRNRLLWSLGAIIVVFLGLVAWANDIYAFVVTPLTSVVGEMQIIQPLDAFFTPFKLTFFVSVFITMPFLLFQVWAFIAPALYRTEKRLAVPILLSSIVLFYAGVAFAYFVVMPLIFTFFNAVAPDVATLVPDIAAVLGLILKLFFAFGLAFEIPVATVILIVAGVISPEGLAKKRPYVVVSCFVFGMLLTPPDIFSQAMLALPMWILFEVGIFFGKMLIKKDKNAENEEATSA